MIQESEQPNGLSVTRAETCLDHSVKFFKSIVRRGFSLVTASRVDDVVVAVCMFHEAREEADIQPYRFKHGERLVYWFPLAPLISDGNQGLLPDSHDILLAAGSWLV